MKHFEERYADYRKKIENYLAGIYAPYGEEPQKLIFEAANYSLLAGGKRLRPIFVMDFCRMCGGEFLERQEQTFCPKCRAMRKKQAQRKYAVLHARGRL